MCRGNLAREAYVYQGTYKGGIFEEGRISVKHIQYIDAGQEGAGRGVAKVVLGRALR